MSKSYFSVLIVTLFVSLIFAGCGDYQRFSLSDSLPLNTKEKEHSKDSDIQILTLELTPSLSRLAVGTTTDFNLMAIFSNGSSKDITRDANWSSSKPEVLNINAGSAQALKVGLVVVTASYLDINVQKTIAISPSFKLSGASTFETDTGELISNGNKLYVPDNWDKEEHILLLGNFTIDAGST